MAARAINILPLLADDTLNDIKQIFLNHPTKTNNLGCLLAIDIPPITIREDGYARMTRTFYLTNGDVLKKHISWHVVMYCLHKGINTNLSGLQVSHLCHKRNCANVEHLSLEPQTVNNSRKSCNKKSKTLPPQKKTCCGHTGYPDCIF